MLIEDSLYAMIEQYVEPEMLILIPVLMFLGWMMKSTPNLPDWLIPYLNTIVAIAGGIILADTVFDGFIQGILISAMSTFTHNLYKQWNKRNSDSPPPSS